MTKPATLTLNRDALARYLKDERIHERREDADKHSTLLFEVGREMYEIDRHAINECAAGRRDSVTATWFATHGHGAGVLSVE
jgi:hypothetical protein